MQLSLSPPHFISFLFISYFVHFLLLKSNFSLLSASIHGPVIGGSAQIFVDWFDSVKLKWTRMSASRGRVPP